MPAAPISEHHLDNLTELDDLHDSQLDQLERMFKAANKVVFFTGAGISTAANIPDYRGPNGVWTARAQGRSAPAGVQMHMALPTETHMALKALCCECAVQGQQASQEISIISQNVDGLHRRSGIGKESIDELHGNTYRETCWNCSESDTKEFIRSFQVQDRSINDGSCAQCRSRVPSFCHCTARVCDACGHNLKDSIVHFSEPLPSQTIERAFRRSEAADLHIVLGSSLTVSPANQLPLATKAKGGKLVVVNLQPTPLDERCDLRIFAKTDAVMKGLMLRLGKEIPSYVQDEDPIRGSINGCESSNEVNSESAEGNDRLLEAEPIPQPALVSKRSVSEVASTMKHISGLWRGEAVCTSDPQDVPTNPCVWSLSCVPSNRPPAPSLFGSGFFDDAADVPGEPCLMYLLQGTFDGLSGSVSFNKKYVNAAIPPELTVQYTGKVSTAVDGSGDVITTMSGTWTNPLESTSGTFGCVLESM